MDRPDIEKIAGAIRKKGIDKPDVTVILGSGLGGFADTLEDAVHIPYSDIPGMPGVSVVGHAGTLHFGYSGGKKVLAFGGRFHRYEGHSLYYTLCPVHIAYALGTKKMIISNAAGSINYQFQVGDLMLINDFLSPCYDMVLPGKPWNKRYDNKPFRHEILQIAAQQKIHLQHGTYCFVLGPTYETKAEIRAFRVMGADVVGMSTAPELLEATQLGIPCTGISLITNMSTGVTSDKLDHAEVKEVGESRKDDFGRLVNAIIEKWN